MARTILVLCSTLAGLAIAELVARQIAPRPTGGVWPRLQTISSVAPGVMPGVSGTVVFSVNRYGLRGPDVPLSAAKLAARLPKDTTVFYDDCHFNVAGSRRVASLVAEQLLSLLAPAAR